MDKQKQINEIANIIFEALNNKGRIANGEGVDIISATIYNAGYRKIPENAVVLTMEEYQMLNYFNNRGEELLKQERKETAEKFAENVNQTINAYKKKVGEDDYVVDARRLIFEVNEICKEITDKEVQNGN